MQNDQRGLQKVSSRLAIVKGELDARWPGWQILTGELDDQSELFDRDRQVIVLDLRHWPEGLAFAARHALTHLDWRHVDEVGPFTDRQCDAADDVARLHTQEQAWVM